MATHTNIGRQGAHEGRGLEMSLWKALEEREKEEVSVLEQGPGKCKMLL